MDEILNAFDEAQGEVVAPTEVVTEIGENGAPDMQNAPQDVAETAPQQEETEQIAQSEQQNAIYAKIRRDAEAHANMAARAEVDKRIARTFGNTNNPYTGNMITSMEEYEIFRQNEDIREAAEARGSTYEDQKKLLDSVRDEIKANDPDIKRTREEADFYRQQLIEKLKIEDLGSIKEHNPKENVKSVDDFGEMFSMLRGQGVDAVDAYEAVRAVNARKAPPPSMGDINGVGMENTSNKYASMSDGDFESVIRAAERGELRK